MITPEIHLADGATVRVRPISPTDTAAHRRLISRLSKSSRYERFLHAVSALSDVDTQHFVDVDGVQRVALVALNPQNEAEIIAIARYDRESQPSRAEVAIVVDDAWQGVGLGTGLLRHLVQHARDAGIRTLIANILADNTRSLALFHGLHLPEHSRMRDGVVELELDLGGTFIDGP